MSSLRTALSALILTLLIAAGTARAQSPPAPPAAPEEVPATQPAEEAPVDPVEPAPPAQPGFPDDPIERLELARQAFQNADYALLRPLLEPIVADGALSAIEDRIAARQWLAVGYFFDAQQVTDPAARQALLEDARAQFLALLREEPTYQLDPLIYPASVVEIFEDVRRANAEELAALSRQMGETTDTPGQLEPIYIERRVDRRMYALNYLPFGAGQFQNDAPIKGTLLAVGQGLALGLNMTSYLMIESLRGADGRFATGADVNSGDYADALTWRNVQYGSLAAFVGLWAIGVVDALIDFEAEAVQIRSLDAPPPELQAGALRLGKPAPLPIGWALHLDW